MHSEYGQSFSKSQEPSVKFLYNGITISVVFILYSYTSHVIYETRVWISNHWSNALDHNLNSNAVQVMRQWILSTVNIVLFDCSSPPTDTVKLNNMYLTHAHLHNVECETGIHSFCGHIQMHCMTSTVGIHIY